MFEDFESGKFETSSIVSTKDDHGSYKPLSNEAVDRKAITKIGYGVREDVMKIWEELDQARNTLAEIQALIVELDQQQYIPHGKSELFITEY